MSVKTFTNTAIQFRHQKRATLLSGSQVFRRLDEIERR